MGVENKGLTATKLPKRAFVGQPPTPVLKKRPNIVWFILDSLRSDYLMEFVHRNPNDFLSKIILSGVTFETVISAAPCSASSNYSCMTGLYPIMTGVTSMYYPDGSNYLNLYNKTIISFPEILKQNGYFTIFIQNGGKYLLPPYGFDILRTKRKRESWKKLACGPCPIDIKDLVYYTEHDQNPKFLCIIFERIHDRCYYKDKGKKFSRKDFFKAMGLINQDIEPFYRQVYKGDTIFILHSDHGRGVLEDRPKKDFLSCRDNKHKTFFTIVDKKLKPKIIQQMVRGIDIMPTLLDYLGLGHNFCQGKSLLPLIQGGTIPESVAILTALYRSDGTNMKIAVRTERWKFVVRKKPKQDTSVQDEIRRNKSKFWKYLEFWKYWGYLERIIAQFKNNKMIKIESTYGVLFDLKDDPNERTDVSKKYPLIVKKMSQEIEKYLSMDTDVAKFYKERNFPYQEYLKARR